MPFLRSDNASICLGGGPGGGPGGGISMDDFLMNFPFLISPDVKDTSVNQTLSRDFQRPLISAWNLMLHRCIPVLQEAKIDFFSPELPRIYEHLESRCKDKFSIKKRYEDKEGNSKFKISVISTGIDSENYYKIKMILN